VGDVHRTEGAEPWSCSAFSFAKAGCQCAANDADSSLPQIPCRSQPLLCKPMFVGKNAVFLRNSSGLKRDGAVEWIRTTTVLLPPAPQAGASASSATTAPFFFNELGAFRVPVSASGAPFGAVRLRENRPFRPARLLPRYPQIFPHFPPLRLGLASLIWCLALPLAGPFAPRSHLSNLAHSSRPFSCAPSGPTEKTPR
jgi:hypothetical protein